MKNLKLLKIVSIAILTVLLLTWVIPASTYDGYNLRFVGMKPVGLWDLFNSVGISIGYFWQPGLFILFAGGFYGVLNKTGTLKLLVDEIKKLFKGKERIFLIISLVFFGIITAITGIYFPLFALVPLFLAVILSMGYSRLMALLCTVGAIMIGSISAIYNDAFYAVLGLENFPNLLYSIMLLVLTLLLTATYIWKIAEVKKSKKKEIENNSLLYLDEHKELKQHHSLWPVAAAFGALSLLLILAMTPWAALFRVEETIFDKWYTSITDFSIREFPIFHNILGETIAPFGSWGTVEFLTIFALLSLFVGIMYKISLRQMFDGFMEGMNRVFSVAVLVVIVNTVVIFTLNSGFYVTIINALVNLTNNFNIVTMAINTFLGSALIVNNVYLANYVLWVTTGVASYQINMPLLALISQAMYGLMMLIAPTSMLLLAGLAYLDVSYVDWVKYIWRLLLVLSGIVFVVLIIAALL
jgi:uncharacterized ion transporter superfamily protein YfcC